MRGGLEGTGCAHVNTGWRRVRSSPHLVLLDDGVHVDLMGHGRADAAARAQPAKHKFVSDLVWV